MTDCNHTLGGINSVYVGKTGTCTHCGVEIVLTDDYEWVKKND